MPVKSISERPHESLTIPSKPLTVAINGFGRIGRCVVRAYAAMNKAEKSKYQIIHIASRGLNPEKAAYFFKYDSTHGRAANEVTIDDSSIDWGDGKIKISDQLTDWNDSSFDIILDCTGSFHFDAQKKVSSESGPTVIISAPYPEPAMTVVVGVNDHLLTDKHKLISASSCTTNCIAPIVKVLQENIGIASAFVTTIHAYTNDQNLLDGSHSDWRRGRAAGLSIVPTSTGAAKNLELIFPELQGKIGGSALRVPTNNVSMVDFIFSTTKTIADSNTINDMMVAEHLRIPKVFGINKEKLVSVDFNQRAESTIFDVNMTKVLENNFCRIVSWYDNEFGFANRMLDLCEIVSSL